MAILSVSICTERGNALVSRQFVEMTRLRVEGLLSAFPRVSGLGRGKQHSYVDTETVRYVYQPLEDRIYLLLLTNKASNIVDDLGTLRLLAKVVKDTVGSNLNEASVRERSFEIIFAFDEAVTGGGYTEDETVGSIRANLLMKSREEDKENEIIKAKEEKAKVIKERRMAQIAKDKREKRMNLSEQFGSDFGGHIGPRHKHIPEQARREKSSGIIDENPKHFVRGMTLRRTRQDAARDELIDSFIKDVGHKNANDVLGHDITSSVPTPPRSTNILMEEHVTVQMSREGSVESSEVKGTLRLITNTAVVGCSITMKNVVPSISQKCDLGWKFATHPKIDKEKYEKESVLALKEGERIPIGRPVNLLKWSTKSADAAPLIINCWPEGNGDGNMNVSLEVSLTRTDLLLSDVGIIMPLGTHRDPHIYSISGVEGEFIHLPEEEEIRWHIGTMDDKKSSALVEFTVSGSDADKLFPVSVSFKSESILCPVDVVGVSSSASGEQVLYSMSKNLSVESYHCGREM